MSVSARTSWKRCHERLPYIYSKDCHKRSRNSSYMCLRPKDLSRFQPASMSHAVYWPEAIVQKILQRLWAATGYDSTQLYGDHSGKAVADFANMKEHHLKGPN